MNSILGLGKYLFAIPFAVFGIRHFMYADAMAGWTPGGAPMVYVSGVALIAAAASMLLGKYDKLATVLLAVMLLVFVGFLHVPAAMKGDWTNLLKDLSLAGAALMYAKTSAKDSSIIGE